MNDSWEHEFKEGRYKFAKPPVKKVDLIYSEVQPGQRLLFTNLLYATKSKRSSFALWSDGKGRLWSKQRTFHTEGVRHTRSEPESPSTAKVSKANELSSLAFRQSGYHSCINRAQRGKRHAAQ